MLELAVITVLIIIIQFSALALGSKRGWTDLGDDFFRKWPVLSTGAISVCIFWPLGSDLISDELQKIAYYPVTNLIWLGTFIVCTLLTNHSLQTYIVRIVYLIYYLLC